MNIKQLKKKVEATNDNVIVLVGTPLAGKSTFIREHFPDIKVISRDDILLEVAETDDYNEAWRKASQKKVTEILRKRLAIAGKKEENVILDMTHMGSKVRRYNLSFFKNHYKVAIVFPFLSDEEVEIRNSKREKEENKTIPLDVIKRMKESYQKINDSEGFNTVIYLD